MELQLKIKNKEGLHARPAGVMAKKAAEFQSNIQISVNGQLKSAKSIMALMSLSLKHEQEFTIIISGPDENEAKLALEVLVNNEFKI